MPYDSNGNYTLPAIYKAQAGTVIMTEQHNTPFEDVQAALNKALLRDGSVPFLANINANNFRIINLASGVSGNDAVNVSQLNTSIGPLLSGTLGVIATNKDQNGLGLHLNGSTSRASFIYASGSGDLAWYSDIATEAQSRAAADTSLSNAIAAETTRAKAAEATAVSGTLGVIAANKDEPITGLHINGATGRPSAVHTSGAADVAWASDVAAEAAARASADTGLQSDINTRISGTVGVIPANGDKSISGFHINGGTGRPSAVTPDGSADVAWASDVAAESSARKNGDASLSSAISSEAQTRQDGDATLSAAISAETTRAKAAESTAVSGTVGVIADAGDKQGTQLHLRGATGNASFGYDGGSFDLASYSALVAMPTLYTGSTSLTVPDGVSVARFEIVGGGGSGCSCQGEGLSTSSYGAGGAAGGYVAFWISVSPGDTIGITVGAGASSPFTTINGQTNGGDTIITKNGTEIARASGGTGGIWNSASSSAGGTGGGASTQNGANPIKFANGSDGGDGQTGATSDPSVSGYGGAGAWGGSGRAGNGGGNDGTGFGSGGGGAYDTSYSGNFYKGGAGHNGCAVVEFK